eukprot:m.467556 g.467556  ORF g.467556 m.467556 type:complete len:464 (+) comp26509_c0_seq1:210-1601(+)
MADFAASSTPDGETTDAHTSVPTASKRRRLDPLPPAAHRPHQAPTSNPHSPHSSGANSAEMPSDGSAVIGARLWVTYSGDEFTARAEIAELCAAAAPADIVPLCTGSVVVPLQSDSKPQAMRDATAALCQRARVLERVAVHVATLDVAPASLDVGTQEAIAESIKAADWAAPLETWRVALGLERLESLRGAKLQLKTASCWNAFDLSPLKKGLEAGVVDKCRVTSVNRGGFGVSVAVRLSATSIVVGLVLMQQAAAWERTKCRGVFDAMLKQASVAPGDVVLDPMCGEGKLLLRIARTAPVLCVGLDSAEAQVDKCRGRVKKAGWFKAGRVDVLHGDATALPFRDNSVDVILCDLPFGKEVYGGVEFSVASNAQLYHDAVAEMSRVLKPGKRATLLTTSPNHPVMQRLQASGEWAVKHFEFCRIAAELIGCVYVLEKSVPTPEDVDLQKINVGQSMRLWAPQY